MSTLTEMLNGKSFHYESMDEGAVVWIEEAKATFKEWLRLVGLTDYYSPNRDGVEFNTTESIRKLLITLVDEP